MASRMDLHMHSVYSDDGEYTPTELVDRCAEHGIQVMALADHNCVRGVAEAGRRAAEQHLLLIPAVELDCVHQGVELHLLGYGIDITEPGFGEYEKNLREQNRQASVKRIAKIEAMGIALDHDEMHRHARDGVVTPEAIAESALHCTENANHSVMQPYLPGGARADDAMLNFYWDIFAQGKVAYVPMVYMPLTEAVALIRRAGGVPVLAHPGNNIQMDAAILTSIVDAGVVGVEAYSSYHSAEQTAFYRTEAEKRGLAVTCGSDFHGRVKPRIEVGSIDCEGREDEILTHLLSLREG